MAKDSIFVRLATLFDLMITLEFSQNFRYILKAFAVGMSDTVIG